MKKQNNKLKTVLIIFWMLTGFALLVFWSLAVGVAWVISAFLWEEINKEKNET